MITRSPFQHTDMSTPLQQCSNRRRPPRGRSHFYNRETNSETNRETYNTLSDDVYDAVSVSGALSDAVSGAGCVSDAVSIAVSLSDRVSVAVTHPVTSTLPVRLSACPSARSKRPPGLFQLCAMATGHNPRGSGR